MSPGSSTESYPALAHIGLRENSGKNLNQVTCPDRESNPGHLVSRPDVLTKGQVTGKDRRTEPLSVVAWNQRGPGYAPGESPSTQFVLETTKCQEWVLEDHDEQVADQPYPRHVRWATCLANVQVRGAVIPSILEEDLHNPRHVWSGILLLKFVIPHRDNSHYARGSTRLGRVIQCL
ncbi:hypothetical protein ANN_07889 [Periplaneta americana]|uniref:Uncharacterized protein n=1 Tax=Periplaneta americana TaxID=6978 RepID=A0ABQ8T154_PERAM|nr:hypothetical protein ANN_07889 [Periplaneta americana]